MKCGLKFVVILHLLEGLKMKSEEITMFLSNSNVKGRFLAEIIFWREVSFK